MATPAVWVLVIIVNYALALVPLVFVIDRSTRRRSSRASWLTAATECRLGRFLVLRDGIWNREHQHMH